MENELIARLIPGDAVTPSLPQILVICAIALVIVSVRPLWRVARLGVTLVHELGHAMVGILVGRKFTGFVLRGDASGHAITVGRPRGPGLVATLWAGYPAPALVGAGLIAAAAAGWAAPIIAVMMVVLLIAMIRIRSGLTALVTIGVFAGLAALWWFRNDGLQILVLATTAAVLIVGAWRHVVVAARDRSGDNDARVLARITGVPRVLWLATFVLVCTAAALVFGWAVVPTETIRTLLPAAG